MRAVLVKACVTAGSAALVTSTIVSAHAEGQFGDIKPGVILRHVEHLSQSSSMGDVVSASADGRTVVVAGYIGYRSDAPRGTDVNDKVEVWSLTAYGWALSAQLDTPSPDPEYQFYHQAVALSADGNHLAVGDPESSGEVDLFDRTATGWSAPTRIYAPDGIDSLFGSTVALSADGSELIVAAPDDFDSRHGVKTGAAFAFARTPTGWSQGHSLVPAGGKTLHNYAEYGMHLAMSADGRSVAISDPSATVDGSRYAGKVVTFTRGIGNVWTAGPVLTAVTPTPYGEFGDESLTMSGDGSTIAAGGGAPPVASKVAVSVFRRTGGGWARSATFEGTAGTDRHTFTGFGASLALSTTGDVLAVGAPTRPAGDLHWVGGVFRYARTGTTWSYLGPTFIRGAVRHEMDGMSVALSGDGARLFIGAPGYERSGSHPAHTGAAYVVG